MNIEKISKIKRENLSGERYFQALLEQGSMAQLLSDSNLEKIQFDCLALLAKRTERFNGGDSSSIRIENAQEILTSMMFTLGVHLKTYENPDDAIAAVLELGIETIYAEGRKRIERLVKQAKMRYVSLVEHLLETENAFYSAIIVDGINSFFKLYDADFAAHEIHITADYPVYNKTKQLLGIEFIGRYLEQLYFENSFCSHFSAEDIYNLLCGYDENHENLLFNLYEPVLAASLGCVIAGADASRLEITPDMQSFLHHHFVGKKSDEIEQMLSLALSKLGEGLLFSDSLMRYVKQSLPLLSVAIVNATKAETHDRVFIASRHSHNSPKVTVSYGEKMDDELYREVLDEFMDCQSIAKKIEVIKQRIHSLADLEDLLLDATLSADEVAVILQGVSPAEIAALMKKYAVENEMSFTELRECEEILCEGLRRLTASLSLEQQALLENAVKMLDVE